MPSSATRSEILTLVVGMFEGSPNADYYNQFASLVDGGTSVLDLSRILAGTSVFDSIYSPSLGNRGFADAFVRNTLGLSSSYDFDTTDASADFRWARDWVEGRLSAGADRGTVVFEAVFGLAATSAGAYQAARAQLENRATVSDYYIARGGAGATLEALQSVVANVTADTQTVTSAQAAIDLGLGSSGSSATVFPGRFDVSDTISSTSAMGEIRVQLEAGRNYILQAVADLIESAFLGSQEPNHTAALQASTGSVSELDPEIAAILGPDGQAVPDWANTNFFTSGAQLSITPTVSGTYVVRIGGEGGTTGAYSASLREITDSSGDIQRSTVSLGSTTQAMVDAPFAHHEFSLDLTAGQTVDITVSSLVSTANPLQRPKFFEVRDPEGRIIDSAIATTASDFGNTAVTLTASTSGTYKFTVGDAYNDLGAFQFQVSAARSGVSYVFAADDYAASISTTGAISGNGSVIGSIDSGGDRDWFAANLVAGTLYTFDLQGQPSNSGTLTDPYIVGIYDASGTLISGTSDDDSGTGYDAQVIYTPTSSGTYYLSAGAYSSSLTGTYTLRLSVPDDYAASTSTTGTISGNGSATGSIESSGDRDWFAASLVAGTLYTFDLQGQPSNSGTLADPYIAGIYNASGTLISGTTDDDSGTGYEAQVIYTPTTSGTYYLSAGAYSSSYTGTYTLRLTVPDDYAASTSTTGTISINGSATGAIDSGGDRDWFAASLVAGTRYTFDLQGQPSSSGTLADPYIAGIYNASGTLISGTADDDSGTGYEAQVIYTPTTSGTYYLSAGAYSTSYTGTYTLRLTVPDDYAASTSTTGAISINGSATGAIDSGGDRDWFAASLVAGTRYTFDLQGQPSNSGTLTDPYIAGIYNASGTLISGTSDDDSGTGYDARATFTPTTSGTYYLSAGAYSSSLTGTYTLRLSSGTGTDTATDDAPASSATTRVLSTSLTGSIETSGDKDWIAMDLTAGTTYRIDLQGRDSSNGTLSDPVINAVYNSSSQAVSGTFDDDSGTGYDSQLNFTPASSERYYLEARAYSGNSGTYTVRLTQISASTIATDYTTGTDLPASTATPASVSVGGAVTSTLGIAGDRDWIAMDLSAGAGYRIDLQGRDSSNGTLADPVIRGIYGSGGTLITSTYDDDSGTGYDSQLRFTPTSTQRYYVEAGSYGTGTGTYTLRVTEISPAPTTGTGGDLPASTATTGLVAIGASFASSIETAGDRDWIATDLTAGTAYRINVRGRASGAGTLSDPIINAVYNSSGQAIANTFNDDGGGNLESRLDFTATTTGRHYIEARGYGTNTGTYTVSVSRNDDDAPASTATTLSVTVGASTGGNIEATGDVDWIAASLAAGTQYQFTLSGSGSGGGTLSSPHINGIYNASGNYVYSGVDYPPAAAVIGVDSVAYFIPSTSGTYYVAANSNSSSGTYTLNLSAIVDDAPASIATTLSLSAGGSITGTIERARDVDWVRASLAAGTQYQIDLAGSGTSAGTLASPSLYGIYDASGDSVSSGVTYSYGSNNNDRVTFTPSASGTYYFAAAAVTGTGTYTLSLSTAGDDAPASSATTLAATIGSSTTGRIEVAGDRDWIGVDLIAGTQYRIDLQGADSGSGSLADPYLRGIYPAAGAAIASTNDDDSGTGLDARVFFTPTTTGRYYIEASGYGSSTGTYSVSTSAESTVTPTQQINTDFSANTNTTASVAVGGSLTSAVDSAGDVDWIRVSLTANRLYEFGIQGAPTSQGTLADPYLNGIYSSSGSLYAGTADDDSGVGYNAATSFAAPTTGDYYVAARGYGNSTGTYAVSVNDQGPISGGTTTGSSSTTNNWTVMVYVAGDNDLEPFAIRDLNEMEAASLPSGVNVVVGVDRVRGYDSSNGNWMDTRFGVISHDYNTGDISSSLSSQGELNTGDPATLTSFINYAAQTRPAQNYALVLWDHGGGLSGVALDESSGNDMLSLNEVRQGIANSTPGSVSVVGFDACLMGMLEQAHALGNVANYMVASQELEPGDGWNYTTWLANAFSGGAAANASTVADAAVSSYGANYQQQRDVTLSAVSLGRMGDVVSALQAFTQATQSAASSDWNAIQAAFTQSTYFTYSDSVDLRGFASSLAGSSGLTATLASTASGLAGAVGNAVTSASSNMSGTNGMSIYWPESRPYDFTSHYNATDISLIGSVAWDSFLESYWAHT